MAMAYTFGHAGDGNIHLVIGAKEEDESVWAKINETNTRIGDKALRLGGTAIGEHGVESGRQNLWQPSMAAHWKRSIILIYNGPLIRLRRNNGQN
jgi:D-lactate dehydrogenase (cytochrome)